jgi:hypothetical protein
VTINGQSGQSRKVSAACGDAEASSTPTSATTNLDNIRITLLLAASPTVTSNYQRAGDATMAALMTTNGVSVEFYYQPQIVSLGLGEFETDHGSNSKRLVSNAIQFGAVLSADDGISGPTTLCFSSTRPVLCPFSFGAQVKRLH